MQLKYYYFAQKVEKTDISMLKTFKETSNLFVQTAILVLRRNRFLGASNFIFLTNHFENLGNFNSFEKSITNDPELEKRNLSKIEFYS
eukprot:snap_masked-scaffold_19-processed-gene-4.10-mRNA-1 protein AED:1.00 eAED:1.00 QI:0/-1/0/0/-1/1/1/0/87